MLGASRHPHHNPLQLSTPFTRCVLTGAIKSLGPALSPNQSSGFELLKLARSNQLNKDLLKRRRCMLFLCRLGVGFAAAVELYLHCMLWICCCC
jgi:hypothetical protein